MLRQLTRLGHRAAAAASQHHQLLDPLQQAPLWSDVLRASQQAPLWQRAACGYCQAAAGAAAAPRRVLAAPGQQQQAWRAYQSGYDQARNKNKKGIVDGSMYLVRRMSAVCPSMLKHAVLCSAGRQAGCSVERLAYLLLIQLTHVCFVRAVRRCSSINIQPF